MRGKRLLCMGGIFILMLPGNGIREKGNVYVIGPSLNSRKKEKEKRQDALRNNHRPFGISLPDIFILMLLLPPVPVIELYRSTVQKFI
jgi:hypothetical protein